MASPLSDVGYEVYTGVLSLGEVRALSKQAATGKFSPIFNRTRRHTEGGVATDVDAGEVTGERMQAMVPGHTVKWLRHRAMRSVGLDAGGLVVRDANFLKRRPGCRPQSLHSDAPHGYFMVIPLIPATSRSVYSIGVVPGSHAGGYRGGSPVRWLRLRAGDVLVASCPLHHCGGGNGARKVGSPVYSLHSFLVHPSVDLGAGAYSGTTYAPIYTNK